VIRAPGSDRANAVASFSRPVQGLVNGGQSRAVVGAKVYVLQANPTAYGAPSLSLLDSRTGHAADSIGYYALTGEYGGFSIAGDYTCTTGRQVYLYVVGGNSGGNGANSAIGLIAALGACPESGNFTTAAPFVFVNEVTTVAAAYAMVGSATDPTHVSSSKIPEASTGVANAALLANVATGFANNKVPQAKIHTFANILAACINSSTPTSSSCNTLFTNARSYGATGTIPGDTAAAALNIARNPHANVSALYALQSNLSPPFLPTLKSAPSDFALPPSPEEDNSVAYAASHP
jgi:hypothetical protein